MRRPLKTTGKILILTLVAIAASLIGGTASLAELHIEPGIRATVFGAGEEGLGVREGPGYGFNSIHTLAEGAEVDVLEGPRWRGYVPWYLVGGFDASGNQGWSAGIYLQPKPEPTPVPRAEPGRTAVPSARGGQRTNRSFVALVTAYSIHGRTASGAPTEWGVVAVDPTIIPLGTRLQIEGFEEVFVAADTGGGVKGNWVDIYFPDYGDAYNFGMQARRVTILE